MRLIDADAFKKQMAAMAIKENYSAEKANAMMKLIDMQPTAFDKEKVLKRLKLYKDVADDRSAEFDEIGDTKNMEKQEEISLAFDRAIKTVNGEWYN